MKCPHCSSVLITLEFAGFEIDRCFKCQGIWLDSGELECLLGPDTENEYMKSLKRAHSGERQKKCPICSSKMAKMTIGTKGILLDLCRDHGMWSDTGELEKILSESSQGNAGRLTYMLQEMLSGNRI
jgi:uncharacterized protein